ncbi:Hsp20/alpha crystallin family protein [Zobellia uliginosa]|uniref:Hsp20/alpha crystallin family protein n=1 Tax=Zobellia uliginosa TaxID=143224 RepID=UPI001C07E271|nr:Hsp20/alpha crystallin family protein [Zobellia uliginosa]MBU2947063.1 Hsp20/alpha crystallin family protein [Zobellia uliginosa]
MSIVKRNNLVFPSLMNEIFKPDWFGGMENVATSTPAVNIKDNEKSFDLELIVPGRKKEDFNIEVDNELLTISSEVKTEEEVKDENYTRREFKFTSFQRAFTLPESIDVDAIKADYVDGVLKVELPKKEEALPKPKRLIELK